MMIIPWDFESGKHPRSRSAVAPRSGGVKRVSRLLSKTERRRFTESIGAARHVLILHWIRRLRSAHLMRLNIITVVGSCAANEGKGGSKENGQAKGSGFNFHFYGIWFGFW